MNLFLFDQAIQFDSLAPIIFMMKKQNKKIIVINTNPVNLHKKNILLNFIKKNNTSVLDYPPTNLSFQIKTFLFKLITLLPKKIISKSEGFWWRVSNNIYFDKSHFINFLVKKNIKNIFIPNDYIFKKKNFFYELKNIKKIKIIEVEVGARTLLSSPYGKNSFPLSMCDYFIASNNNIADIDPNQLEKVKFLGSLRYNSYWQKELDKINNVKFQTEKHKLKVGLLVNDRMLQKDNNFLNRLKKIRNVELEIVHKPKSVMPEKCCDYFNDKFNAFQLINWADIIVSHSSTLLIEAIQKNKVVFYCSFLDYHNEFNIKKSVFDQISGFYYFNNIDRLIESISNYSQLNKKNYSNSDFDIIHNLKGFKNDNDLINNYKKFINNL